MTKEHIDNIFFGGFSQKHYFGDAHNHLLREEGRQFDVIFGDLTDIPVHGNDTSTWNFVRWEKKKTLSFFSC